MLPFPECQLTFSKEVRSATRATHGHLRIGPTSGVRDPRYPRAFPDRTDRPRPALTTGILGSDLPSNQPYCPRPALTTGILGSDYPLPHCASNKHVRSSVGSVGQGPTRSYGDCFLFVTFQVSSLLSLPPPAEFLVAFLAPGGACTYSNSPRRPRRASFSSSG